MKVIFVGIHNKPGKSPLDSSTHTGKMIDEIGQSLPRTCIIAKSNLFNQEMHPEVDRRKLMELMPHVDEWVKRINYQPGDHIACLGDLVYGCFSYWHRAINKGPRPLLIKMYHPSSRWARNNRLLYVADAIERINHNLKENGKG